MRSVVEDLALVLDRRPGRSGRFSASQRLEHRAERLARCGRRRRLVHHLVLQRRADVGRRSRRRWTRISRSMLAAARRLAARAAARHARSCARTRPSRARPGGRTRRCRPASWCRAGWRRGPTRRRTRRPRRAPAATVSLGVDDDLAVDVGRDAAHGVVRRRLDRDRLGLRLDAQVGAHEVGDVGELVVDRSWRQVGQVEVDVVLAVDAATLADLLIDARETMSRGARSLSVGRSAP